MGEEDGEKRRKKNNGWVSIAFFFSFPIPHHCVLFCITYQKQTRKPLNTERRTREKKITDGDEKVFCLFCID
jgi:hypothetical protein